MKIVLAAATCVLSMILWVAAYGLVRQIWVALLCHAIPFVLTFMLDGSGEMNFVFLVNSLASIWVWVHVSAGGFFFTPPACIQAFAAILTAVTTRENE